MSGDDPGGANRSDDLQAISGIGPGVATALEQLGIRTFADLAACRPEELSSRLRESGLKIAPTRIRNANWIGQAKNRAARRPAPAEPSLPEEPATVAAREPEPPPAEEEPPPAAEEPAPHATPAGRLDDVAIAVGSLPGRLAEAGRPLLEATVTFTPSGEFETPQEAEAVAARVRVFAISLEDEASRLVGVDELPLEPDDHACATHLPFECPPRGRYRFEATVEVIDARRRVAETVSQEVLIPA